MQTPTSTITVTGDLGGRKVAMGFDENSLAHLQSLFIDMYSDPMGAVIREYSTNALDAHVQAGNTDPIEVFTPSTLSPYFRVVDHGIGLSVNDIENIFSKYGASTKRNTNSQVGMLGIGCKSGLTLSPQFNLTSVKDGVKIFVVVSRASDGSGQMEIIDTKATTESNGVEISIPVSNHYAFNEKARQFFMFWRPGTVLVNGQQPKHLEGKPVGDKFVINRNLDNDYVVMGNVAYSVEGGLYSGGSFFYNKMGIVAQVSIGDVNFTPSREALHYTAHTKATIERLKKEFLSLLRKSAEADVTAAPTFKDAWASAVEWKKSSGLSDFRYKGVKVPSLGLSINKTRLWKALSGYGSRSARWQSEIYLSESERSIIVYNAPSEMKLTPLQRKKVQKYCEDKGIASVYHAYITSSPTLAEDPTQEPFFESFNRVDWSDIVKIHIPRTNQLGVVRTEPYDLYVDGYTTKQVSTLDTSKPICYYSTAEFDDKQYRMHQKFAVDTQIVVLSKNRWEKFKRDFPTSMHWTELLKIRREELLKKMTFDDRVLSHYSYHVLSNSRIPVDRVDDPDLARFITALRSKKSSALIEYELTGAREAGISRPEDPLTKYPMADSLRKADNEHALWYLNTYYKHLTDNNLI